jgi:chloride channel protein, CIC family
VPGDAAPAPRLLSSPALWGVAIVVGIVAGLGAVAFRELIGLVHNLLFFGRLSAAYNANAHTPASRWGPYAILIPVLGSFGTAFLVKNFAPEAKGHGVPEVMDAVYHRRGVVRPIVSAVKACASALSIGSGGSVGREGPIIQIGSSFGSTVGQLLHLPAWQRITLVAAGAGGGIAATFNTPVGGVLFAMEIIMHEVSARTLIPVVTATAAATYIGQLFFGPHPSFYIPAFETPYFSVTRPLVLAAYVALGAVTGLVSAMFIWSVYRGETVFEKHVKGGYYVQHALGMLGVGLLMYALLRGFGHYYIEGVGYSTIQDILTGARAPVYLLALLFGAKLLATALTLGSGASGGIFSPALYLGATAGALFGIGLNHWFPSLHVSPAAFAVAGMGGVVGSATGAAIAAIVMIFEMTLDYTAILPMTLTVAIGYGVRRSLIRDSIYTRKLVLRKAPIPETMRADLSASVRAADLMEPAVRRPVQLDETLKADEPNLVVTDEYGKVTGVVAMEAHGSERKDRRLSDLIQTDYVFVAPSASLWDVLQAMHSQDASVALVAMRRTPAGTPEVTGIITRKRALATLAEEAELFC